MKRLLIVDDSRGVRTFMQHHLAGSFKIAVASDGREGLEKAQSGRFDLILSDINQPHYTGFELFNRIRAEAPEQGMALMTDADIDKYLPEALEFGIGNIFAKAAFRFDLEGSVRLLHDLIRNRLFGMHRRLGPGGEVRTFVLNSELELPDVLGQCASILDKFPKRDIYRVLMPELVRNAFVHGRVSNGVSEAVHLSVGADWQRVGFGVSDPAGGLTLRKTLEWLVQNQHKSPPGRASGQGLISSRQLMDQTLINVLPGQQTEILTFDLLQPYHGSRSLHINEAASLR